LVALNSSLSVPDLDTILTHLSTLNDSVSNMQSPQLFIDNARALNNTLHNPGTVSSRFMIILSVNANVIDVLHVYLYWSGWVLEMQPFVQAAYDALGIAPVIPTPPKPQLLSAVDGLRTAINNRPNSATMKTSLVSMNNTINSLPNIATMTTSIDNLNTQITSFPNISMASIRSHLLDFTWSDLYCSIGWKQ
jgi:hypothetical protein